MIRLLKSNEDIKQLKLDFDGVTSLIQSGSARFAGETFDVLQPDKIHIKRVTFGWNKILNRVAITSEILREHYEEKPDIVDRILNRSFIENQWE